MNRLWIAILLAMGAFLAPGRIVAQDINVQFSGGEARGIDYFYEALSPYGNWVQTADYGWVWTPAVSEGWRPYTDGHWVDTDDYGWTWVSDNPWGWATDHYGRWYSDDDYGWCWVPGTHWGPAWVAWREGEGCIGWAPLPPEGRAIDFGPTISLNIGEDVVGRLRPYEWCFVRDHDFLAQRCSTVILQPRESVTIINRTKNITNYNVEGDRVINRSVDRSRVKEWTGRPVQPVKIRAANSPGEHGRAEAGAVEIYRPKIEQRGSARPAPPPQVVEKSRTANNEIKQRHQKDVQALTGAGVKVEPHGRQPGANEVRTNIEPPKQPTSPQGNQPTDHPREPAVRPPAAQPGERPGRNAPERTAPQPSTERSKPAQPPERTAPEPRTERSQPAPPPERSAPAPSSERSKPAPPPERSAPAPSSERSKPAPPPERSAPAPSSERSKPAPPPERSAPAPSSERSKPEPPPERSAPAPSSERSRPAQPR